MEGAIYGLDADETGRDTGAGDRGTGEKTGAVLSASIDGDCGSDYGAITSETLVITRTSLRGYHGSLTRHLTKKIFM